MNASFKNQTYKVIIDLNDDFKINDNMTSCNCANGKAKWALVVALSMHAYHGISSTDVNCSWKQPAAATIVDDTLTIDDFYPNEYTTACSRELTSEEKKNFIIQSTKHNIGFKWLLKPDEGPIH